MAAKICTKCRILKWDDEFGIDKRNKDQLQSSCKHCYLKSVLLWQIKYPEKHNKLCRDYEKRHPKKKRANRMKYHASKLQRVAAWANLGKIKQVYLNCPKGKVVDHIIPLQGKTVSGFHHENNLQYLTPKQNSSKGNRYGEVCVY